MIFDTLSNLELYVPVVPQLRTVIEAMDHDNVYDLPKGHYTTPDPAVTYDVVEIVGTDAKVPFHFHKHKTIIEIVLSGKELQSTSWREMCHQCDVYNKNTDIGLFNAEPISALQGAQGRFAVFLSGEPYKTGVSDGSEEIIRKAVFSVVEK